MFDIVVVVCLLLFIAMVEVKMPRVFPDSWQPIARGYLSRLCQDCLLTSLPSSRRVLLSFPCSHLGVFRPQQYQPGPWPPHWSPHCKTRTYIYYLVSQFLERGWVSVYFHAPPVSSDQDFRHCWTCGDIECILTLPQP